jgi:hypothetical protein
MLSADDCHFMLELVRNKPGLFLDKLQERLYDTNGTLISITRLHENLIDTMNITLKKVDTVNISKSLRAKYQFIAKMASVTAEFLVFTGESHDLLLICLYFSSIILLCCIKCADESAICSRDLLQTFA